MAPTTATPPNFITALQRPEAWPHPVSGITLVETHISWVLLTGEYAYKIKKPVDFGFLDFSSLDKRLHCCREEVRLNRRLAPEIYLDVVPLCGTAEQPSVGGDGEVFEYAVRMRQFDVHRGFDYLLACGELTAAHMDQTAAMLATFQGQADIAAVDSGYGTVDAVMRPVAENFLQIREALQGLDGNLPLQPQLEHLENWSLGAARNLHTVIAQRLARGFVREGHGDLHLRNIIDWNGRIIPFDCIEFNPELRWIDVISELSFLLMDLDDHQSGHLSRRLLNAWLEYTGDYAGVQLLRFYMAYRAMVRAKVASLRLLQATTDREVEERDFSNYVTLAERYTRPEPVQLMITHGLSGSGKTWFSQQLLEALPLIRLRSDVERKRLFGLQHSDRSGAGSAGLYRSAASERTYAHLRETAAKLLGCGWSVIVDAAFLRLEHRELFRRLAQDMQVPFAIVHCEVDDSVVRRRLRERQRANKDASDADEAVYEQQLLAVEPLSGDELGLCLRADVAAVQAWIHAC